MSTQYRPEHRLRLWFALLCLSFLACGNELPGTPVDMDGGPPVAGDWNRLIDVTWTLQPGEEKYICSTRTVTSDVFVSGFRPVPTPFVHHSQLSYDDAQGPDEAAYPCHGNGDRFYAFATGAGTNEFVFPNAAGIRVRAGQQLRLTTHLFNTGDAVQTVTAGVDGFVVAGGTVENEAEMYVTGPVDFTDAPATLASDCVLDRDQTLVSILPHMHGRGRHFKAELIAVDGTTTVLFDDAFTFDHQAIVPLLNVAQAGDKVRTTCTWDTTTGAIKFGSSTNDEMCYSFLTRYPAVGSSDHFCKH